MTTGTVLQVAWGAVGSPADHVTAVGCCGRCGRDGKGVALRAVVSKNFTDFDGWADPTSSFLCASCSWALGNPALRQSAHVVRPGECSSARAPEVCELLSAGCLPGEVAVIVPLRPGRKHLIPRARWGCVTTEELTMRWGAADALRLRKVTQLRAWGFTAADLTATAPPFPAVRRVQVDLWRTVFALWEDLDVWRQEQRPWMSLALKISIEEK